MERGSAEGREEVLLKFLISIFITLPLLPGGKDRPTDMV